MKKKFLFATAVIACMVVASCQKVGPESETEDPVTPTSDYVKKFAFTASSVGSFDENWNKYFIEHFGLMASGFSSTASVTFLDGSSLGTHKEEVVDFIEDGKICAIVNPDDNFANWLQENVPDVGAVCGDWNADDVVFTAVTNDAIFIQHNDNVEKFNPEEHRSPDEVIEDGEKTSDNEVSLDDPLNYQFVLEWLEGVIHEHYINLCSTKSPNVIPLPENDEYRKAKHYPRRTDTWKHTFKMQAKRLSFDDPYMDTSGEAAVEYIFTPLYCYEGQGTKDAGDYYLVERNLYVMSSDTEKWHGDCVRTWGGSIKWYARGGYLYQAEVTSNLVCDTLCTAEMIGTVSPQTQNNVATYTSNFTESMGVKVAPAASGTRGTSPGGSLTLGDLFNWNRSYSHGKQATLKDFGILNHSPMGASPVKHTATYEEKAFPELSSDKRQYGKAADLAISTAIFPSHWIWHISGTKDEMVDPVIKVQTNLNVSWGWSHRSSNSSNYNPVHPYGPECTNKSTLSISTKEIPVPAPSRTSYGRIVLKNDSENYLYGIRVSDKDNPEIVYFEDNIGTIAPGKELILTALQNKPKSTTPVKYTFECQMGPNGHSLKTYKYSNSRYGDHFSVSKCIDKDRDSFNISIKSDMVEK